MLKVFRSSDETAVERLFNRRRARLEEAESAVRPIIEDVRRRGDAALVEHAKKFDELTAETVRVDRGRLQEAAESVESDFRTAVETASRQIREFARLQKPHTFFREVGNGIHLGQIVRPLDSVAAYIPGGRYPLPSTLMMTVLPAQEAGVRRISVCSPSLSSEILATAGLLGVRDFFHMGGAQAIAAFAIGTETVPKAQRIVGPGNVYVAAAKKLLAGETGIDFIAGPTEILLIWPEGDAEQLAADMLAQAEHDVDAAAILLTTSEDLAKAVSAEVDRQIETLTTRAVAESAIRNNSAIVITDSLIEACDFSNRFGPEHLSLHDDSLLDEVTSAGSVFIGPWSPEAAGDYASGPNHVLPTSGAAHLRAGLSVLDYLKVITVQQLSSEGLQRIAPAAVTLARAEGLEAHARSIEVRVRD